MKDKLYKNNHSSAFYHFKKSAIIGAFLACIALVVMVPVFVSNNAHNADAADTPSTLNIEEEVSMDETSTSVNISNT